MPMKPSNKFGLNLLFFLIAMCSLTSFAQEVADVDQLKKELSIAKTSAIKLDILNKIAAAYAKTDTTNTSFYVNQAILLADKVGDVSAKANAYYTQAQSYYFKSKGDRAFPLYLKASQLQKQLNKKEEYASALTGIGKSYILMTKYEQGIPYVEKAIAVYKELNHTGGLISNYNQLGIMYNAMGKKDIAIEHFISSLKIVTDLKDQPGFVSLQINIGRLYWEIGQFEQAKKFFLNAIQKANEKKDFLNSGKANLNLANIYIEQKNYNEAIKLINDATVVFEKVDFKLGLVSCYNNLGALKIRQEKFKESIPYLKKALEYIDQKNDKSGAVLTQQNIAYAYTMLQDYEEATKWFALSETEVSKGGVTPYVMGELYKHVAILDSLKGDYQKALDHKTKFYAISNSQLNEKISKQINELQTKYETSKKEAQIFLLSKENDIKALQLNNNALEISKNKSLLTAQQQQITINGLELSNKNQALANQKLDAQKKAQNIKALQKQSRIQNLELQNKKLELEQRNLAMGSILVVFLALGGISFSFYKRNQLKQQNLLQTEIYRQQEIATKSVFEGEQNERIRIARDLHDGIGQMLSVVKMNVSTLNPTDKTVEGTLHLVDKTITELREISHNLIPEALNFGLFAALEDICKKINDAGQTKVGLNVAQEMDEVPLSQQNKLSIYRIVQEVLNNMIKHANASYISIDIKKINENMLIAIKDDGDGFDTSKIDDSKGMGWKNISARVHLMDGDMNIKSEKLIGTQIEISIPA